VLLGDLFDFLQVELPEPHKTGVTSSDSTLAKLEIVARGHPEVFRALGRFLAAGNRIEIVIGNHDIELIWPAVQARLRELLMAHASVEVAEQIAVHPWIFYLPGVVYAEHGHQYDAVNSFATMLRPFLPWDPTRLELPLGSFFVLYLFNKIEWLDPFVDNVKPATRYVLWALRVHPLLLLRTFGYHLRFLVLALGKTSSLSAAEQRARRDSYRQEVVEPAAHQIGLPPETVVRIDELAAIPTTASQWRQLTALLLPISGTDLLLSASLLGGYRMLRRAWSIPRPVVALGSALAALLWREARAGQPVTQPGGYLFAAARQIHAELQRVGAAVPAYVFGHTHTVEQFALDGDEDAPRYLNTGTWTPLVPGTFDLLGTRERFSFVQITRDPEQDSVLASLLIWNDNAERVEPLLRL
jgi:UDP-2,3-diacylglucosamine pyrophosphatase LpxH